MTFAVDNRHSLDMELFHNTSSSSSGLYLVHEEDEGPPEPYGSRMARYTVPDGDYDEDAEYLAKLQQEQSIFERSQNAKRIRRQQLEDWRNREKQPPGSLRGGRPGLSLERMPRVKFEWNVLLMDAVLHDETDEVARLLGAYEDEEHAARTELVNCRSPDGLTPLHQCCIENLENMARLLIQNGADIRAPDSELWTPLHAAATCGHLAMVRLLTEYAKTRQTSTSDSTDLVKDMLLAINSDCNMPFDLCEDDQTRAFIEREMQLRGITQDDIEARRHKKEVDMLRDLQQYIDSNLKRSGSFRQYSGPARLASLREMWMKFIATSKNPNAVMMHIAAANGYLDVMDLLLKNKFPADLEDDDGWLPIHAAVAWNQPEAAKLLVNSGADITARVKGTNETALELAHAADLSLLDGDSEKPFHDQLMEWDTAYKNLRAKEAKEVRYGGSSSVARHPSSESITSAPSSSSPLMKRSSPKMARVQRKSSLKDKEDLIALLQTLGAHDLHSSEKNQSSFTKFARSPGGSLRDKNPTLPNVPEEAVTSSAVVEIGQGDDADLIDQTISPELLSSLLRSSFDDAEEDEQEDENTEQFLRDAAESLNQIDQPVTLSQLKHSRSRFRLLKRKEKAFVPRELAKDSLKETLVSEDSVGVKRRGSTAGGSVTKLDVTPKKATANGILDSQEMKKFTSTKEEGPVGGVARSSPKLLHFAKAKKDKIYNIPSFRGGTKPREREPVSEESATQKQLKRGAISSNGCCVLS